MFYSFSMSVSGFRHIVKPRLALAILERSDRRTLLPLAVVLGKELLLGLSGDDFLRGTEVVDFHGVS